MAKLLDELRSAVRGRHPLLYCQTAEEGRVIDALKALIAEGTVRGAVSCWSCTGGMDGADARATRDPVEALRGILADPHEGFYLMKDLTDFFGRPEVVRSLRDAYERLGCRGTTFLVVVSPVLNIPDLLEKELCAVEVPLPATDELIQAMGDVLAEHPGAEVAEGMRAELALALRGLTVKEARHILHRVFGGRQSDERELFNLVFAEKKLLLRKSAFLEFIPNRTDINNVGGLEVLKEWALKRRDLFTQKALSEGLPVPKGVLVMGVSGCGKSLSAKAIAALWRVPLFRLDMNLVFSEIYGNPEAAFHKALRAIESVAPALLWIDEIENALGMTSQTMSAEQSLTFSSFLTWMQERPPLIFVTATANRIESLPAEIIRKGRFDEVFFCDLPSEDERRQIFHVHLKLHGVDPATIDVDRLLTSTEGWSGAEIEQAVIAATIDAHRESRAVTLEDIKHHTLRMVPLSTTMAEQIRAIRSWAFNRATRASKRPRGMMG